ncbi:unnamed protein product [Mycena citricolor]|uniref:Malate dehydrogenase n=1 Tax=Mycena citricolor TaxID=2018698 RepID=A0AAD2HJ73_9AGAR|nr:unnamed protein product [Mycena citricolor]
MFAKLILPLVFFAALVAGAPSQCNPTRASPDLPAGQTTLVAPNLPVKFVTLGVGIQNYTCSSTTLTYTSIGAIASIFDISCLEGTVGFDNLQEYAFDVWSEEKGLGLVDGIGPLFGASRKLGNHFFVTSPSGTGISAEWDFSSSLGPGTSSFVIASKIADLVAPKNPSVNVDWLELAQLKGTLATNVFRIDTVGGQPPTSCKAGSSISVKYVAKYWFY